MEKKKKDCHNRVLVILMTICVTLSIITLGIVIYDKFIKKEETKTCNCPTCVVGDNTKQERKVTVKKDTEDYVLDFDSLEDRLANSVNNDHKKIVLSMCDCNGIDFDNIEDMTCDNKELSVDSIGVVINKLYSSKKVEWVPTSRACADYTYLIEDSHFFIFEADDKSILLAGIDQDGYAFHYDNEDVRDFLKNLS